MSEGANYTSDVFIRTSTVFFNATRVLAYQLLHAPLTRTHHAIPFIVLVTPTVPQIRRDRLTADGCTVIEVSPISIPWMDSEASGRWRDVATKLHLVNMTAYERIAFIDADMLLRLPLDDLFREPAIRDPTPTRVNPAEVKDDEAVLPESYVFAAAAELEHFEHAIPPGPADAPNLNAGFWVVRPDVALFEYYLSVLNAPWRFFPAFPEQAMLNYAHRVTGNMPWARLRWDWNVNFATAKDLQEGARSLHGKWWMEDGDGAFPLSCSVYLAFLSSALPSSLPSRFVSPFVFHLPLALTDRSIPHAQRSSADDFPNRHVEPIRPRDRAHVALRPRRDAGVLGGARGRRLERAG